MKPQLPIVLLVLFGLMLSACGDSPATVSPAPSQESRAGGAASADPQATAGPAESITSSTETTVPIVHSIFPGEPVYLLSQMVNECSMGLATASAMPLTIYLPCDAWSINYLERPFSLDGTQYYPSIDIEFSQLGYTSEWFYIRMKVYDASLPGDQEPITYAIELDMGFDGRGDFLLAVQDLPLDQGQWTVSGVRAWRDGNGDVGGSTSVRSDDSSGGDGYETLMFDQGGGGDPDLVWVRRSPGNSSIIEFAFKSSLADPAGAFLWLGWAVKGEFIPGQFDLVDRSAGRFQLDNTCSLEFNHASVSLPNTCQVLRPDPTPVPAQTCVKPDRPSSDPCWIWMENQCSWICFN